MKHISVSLDVCLSQMSFGYYKMYFILGSAVVGNIILTQV